MIYKIVLFIMVFPWAIFLLSNDNNIIAYNFACFAANDARGQQAVTRNGASCP